ncbi:HAD hydrolase-like protein [Cellulomonas fimi]|uniref:Haloacid dehalogenase domain protein hydrolase n=1 Tax=Cellulomonas fimi (strain ATCC 484 / DSM 20113 / JCM 1341 / CCUG 24087 / LMG 16345 / NBRC 15513 / NCIMB 8980 / NCTC 7547 / NRS-133) TaxID=590998 RepID=F4H6H5_CELFA|nr:HAD hydrolase-like protein [Cellulomonas fimi]AEE45608.1 Haloacid dehalogenase domain protein hydrolase [Cellulomonas fimi ATCC 484]NNH05884.1 HAD hydrolase-like protein [Cellulomonas fimi]VEH30051.1 5'-nucleotidase [Cellulomonas fimi]
MPAPLVLLDLDGTLVDSAPGITACVAAAYRSVGLPAPDAATLRSFVGPGIWESLRRHGVPEELVPDVVAAYRERYAATGRHDATVFDGIPALLGDLRAAGIRLLVATAKPEAFAVPICGDLGLTPLLDGIFGTSLDESTSKAQVVARALASAPDHDPATTLMVGDREHDVHGAGEHGVGCIGVTWGYAAPGELAAAGALEVVGTADALRAALLARLGADAVV